MTICNHRSALAIHGLQSPSRESPLIPSIAALAISLSISMKPALHCPNFNSSVPSQHPDPTVTHPARPLTHMQHLMQHANPTAHPETSPITSYSYISHLAHPQEYLVPRLISSSLPTAPPVPPTCATPRPIIPPLTNIYTTNTVAYPMNIATNTHIFLQYLSAQTRISE